MNFELYVFEKSNGVYSQYVDDSTKDIFQNVKIQSEEQLSVCHEETLVYYIYTKQTSVGYIGFSIVFNGVIYTDFAGLYTLFRYLTTEANFYKINGNNIIEDEFYQRFLNIIINNRFYKHLFVTCDKPTYNLKDESSVGEKNFDISGITTNKFLKITALVNAIKQYKWTYILPQIPIEDSSADNISRERTSGTNNVSFKGSTIFITIIVVFIFLIILAGIYYHKDDERIIDNGASETAVEEIIEENTIPAETMKGETNDTKNIKKNTKPSYNNNSYWKNESDDDSKYSNETYW